MAKKKVHDSVRAVYGNTKLRKSNSESDKSHIAPSSNDKIA